MRQVRFEEQFPEPLRCWIVHAPSRWAGPECWWLDLAREQLVDGERAAQAAFPPAESAGLAEGLTDVTYLPPVGAVHNWWRQELRERLVESRCDPVVQCLLGEDLEAGGGTVVVDLTPALLPPRLALLDSVPSGAHCCWPLIPGLTSDEALWREGLERLAKAGASGVQPMIPELSSTIRRRLGERAGRQGYQELFHGPSPDLRGFARAAHDLGLAAFVERPACGRTGRALANRKIATRLLMIGELIQRTRGSVDESLGFYRAGRWADRESLDIADLVRGGNLGLVPELRHESALEIERLVRGAASERLADLEREYRGVRPRSVRS